MPPPPPTSSFLCDADRRKIEAKLGSKATPADVDLATNIVALFAEYAGNDEPVKHSQSIDGGILSVRWKLVARVPSTLVNALLALSSRITSIELDLGNRQLNVIAAASNVAAAAAAAAPSQQRRRKRRRIDFDFGALHIDDVDDRRALESLIDDVYAQSPLMPSLAIGVEPLVDRRGGGGGALTSADDATENEVAPKLGRLPPPLPRN